MGLPCWQVLDYVDELGLWLQVLLLNGQQSSYSSHHTRACFGLCAGYAFFLSPNQTPYRDQIFIKLLTGISQDSTFKVNAVYFR